MNKNFLAVALGSVLLTSCGMGDSEPTGQVVATVEGEEITVADLNMELSGAKSDDPEQMKKMRDAALRSIVNRHILANAAEEQGVVDTPQGAMMIKKADQLAKIQLLQQKAQSSAKKPTPAEARAFVSQNHENFSNRKIFLVDQLIVPSISAAVVKQMQPLDTIAEIKALLSANNVDYNNSVGSVDSLSIPAAASQQISRLSVGDVFVVPQGRGVRVNRLRSIDNAPISGEAAEKLALQILGNQGLKNQGQEQLQSYITAAQEKVKYNKEFEPAPLPNPSGAPTTKPAAAAKTDAASASDADEN